VITVLCIRQGKREGGGSRDSGLGTRDSGLGTRDSGLGTRDSGLGTRDSGLASRTVGKKEGYSGGRRREDGAPFFLPSNLCLPN
jgi:hypothetical protein